MRSPRHFSLSSSGVANTSVRADSSFGEASDYPCPPLHLTKGLFDYVHELRNITITCIQTVVVFDLKPLIRYGIFSLFHQHYLPHRIQSAGYFSADQVDSAREVLSIEGQLVYPSLHRTVY